MKKLISLASKIMMLVVALIVSVTTVNAASSIPSSVKSDYFNGFDQGIKQIQLLDNYPIIYKTADNGKYFVYCLNQNKTYAGNITFNKMGTVDEGFAYIVSHRPNTSNKEKDFYITQMAVWYYEDYLNQNNDNLPLEVKKYLIYHKDSGISKEIYDLYYHAKCFKENKFSFILNKDEVRFTVKDGYFVSDEIVIENNAIDKKLSYSLSNAPIGSQVVESNNGVIVKVPYDQISEGKQVSVKLHVSGKGYKRTAYYYANSSKYQNVLFQDTIDTVANLSDTLTMVAGRKKESYEVRISKTDVTQSKEIADASLIVKNADGAIVDSWKSTTTSHYLNLKPGNYTLNETVAPKGYKLSKTTIYFQVGSNGEVKVKNNLGNYQTVNRVVMINELKDVISIAKKDYSTDKFVEGAKMIIKDSKESTVKEFTSTNTVYQIELDEGIYTLSELEAPKGYIKSNEVVTFKVENDGTLQVKNNKGEYVDSAMVVFYNKKKGGSTTTTTVKVPATGKDSYVAIISGIALLIGGAYIAKKTIKGC